MTYIERDEGMAEQEKEILEEAVEETVETTEMTQGEQDLEMEEGAEESAEESEEEEVISGSDEPKTWAEKIAAKKQEKAEKKEKANADKEKIAELEDKVKRQLAEFENFRNRTEKEKQVMFETGAKSVLEKILPVIDNFERGFSTVEEEDAEDAFVQGMQKVYKQLMTELDSIGVKPIEAIGQEFDPNLHNAVIQVESEEFESGVVAQELMKGYTYRDSVVRHSMVGVVSGK